MVTSTLESLDDDHDDEEDTNGCFAFIKRSMFNLRNAKKVDFITYLFLEWQKFTEPKTVSEDDMDSLELYYLSEFKRTFTISLCYILAIYEQVFQLPFEVEWNSVNGHSIYANYNTFLNISIIVIDIVYKNILN